MRIVPQNNMPRMKKTRFSHVTNQGIYLARGTCITSLKIANLIGISSSMSISEKDYSSFKGHRNIREMMRENYKFNRSISTRNAL